jgi:DNA-binding MarR family transcriptional regulator
MEVIAMPAPRNARGGPRTDSTVPPVGDEVDLYALPLTALVARLSHQLGRKLAAEYAAQDITAKPLDASLFILLARGDARLTELAARLSTSKQALVFVVDRLERDGYLVRVADPEDRRAKRIQLTQAGRQVAQRSDAAMRRIERRWRVRAGDWARLRAKLADLASTREP